jgi:hypothetical protein
VPGNHVLAAPGDIDEAGRGIGRGVRQ